MGELQGVGIGLRKALFEPLLATNRRVDWLEVVSENYLDATGRADAMLARFAERWPIVPHGVALSVGTAPPDGYVEKLTALAARLSPPYLSDHCCYSSIGARNFLDLLPLPRHDEAIARIVTNARAVSAATGCSLVLENITTYAEMPGSIYDEGTFLRRIAEEAGVGLLLDVTNLHLNAVNHGLDPLALLDAFPLEHVRQLHLAGFTQDGNVLLDTHSAPIAAPVWDLYREVIKRRGAIPTLIEWDQHIPPLDVVLDEADRARSLMERHG